MTREEWLLKAIEILRADLQHITPLPSRIEILDDWPDGVGYTESGSIFGACFDLSGYDGSGYPSIFITPLFSDPLEILKTLVHELIHASIGCKYQHGLLFQNPAALIGLKPLHNKWTTTFADKKLQVRLGEIADILGPYPKETS